MSEPSAIPPSPKRKGAGAHAVEKRRRSAARPKPKRQPRYHVILWDDPNHTYAYVIVMLQQLFGYPLTKGFQLADEVEQSRQGNRADHHAGARRAEARPDSGLRQRRF